jgi:hypothetical protein
MQPVCFELMHVSTGVDTSQIIELAHSFAGNTKSLVLKRYMVDDTGSGSQKWATVHERI